MQNLIKFFVRNGAVILFVTLELICCRMVVQTNHRQAQIYQNTALRINGALQSRTDAWRDFWSLREVNDSLRMENAGLRSDLINRMVYRDPEVGSIDSLLSIYVVIPARVIQNSIAQRNNYMMLDRGTTSGIDRGMGVVSAAGPVGIVVGATRGYAKVMSVLHSEAQISAAVKHKRYFGVLDWQGPNPQFMRLNAVPKHARILVGDTVVTSGYSSIFPADIPVGTIDALWLPRGSNFYDITVRLHEDLSTLHSCYVVKNSARVEQIALDSIVRNE